MTSNKALSGVLSQKQVLNRLQHPICLGSFGQVNPSQSTERRQCTSVWEPIDSSQRSSLTSVSVSVIQVLGDFTLKSSSAVKQMHHPSLGSSLRNRWFSSCCPAGEKAESNWTFRGNLAQRNSIIWTGPWPELWVNTPTGKSHQGPYFWIGSDISNFLKTSFGKFPLAKSIPPATYTSEMLTVLLYWISL